MDDDATQHYTPKVKDGVEQNSDISSVPAGESQFPVAKQKKSAREEMEEKILRDRENERKETLWKKSPESLPESQRLLRAFAEFDEICIQNPDKGFVCEFPSLVLSPHSGDDLYLRFSEGEDGRRPYVDLCHGSYFSDVKTCVARFHSIEELYAYEDAKYGPQLVEIAKALERLVHV